MTRSDASPTVEQLMHLWWIRLPLALRRVSLTLTVGLVDGLYLTTQRQVAAFAPLIALAVGFLFGATHLGFQDVFSESLVFLLLAVVVGVMSGNLGAMLLAGFAVGDFFLAHPYWSQPGGFVTHLLQVRVPLLIEYNLLALLVIGIPLFTKALLVQIVPPASLSRSVRFGIALIGHLVLTAVLVFFWAQTVPILIRPVFTWSGGFPPITAMEQLQQRGTVLVVAAVIASLIRMWFQSRTAFRSELGARLDSAQVQLTAAPPVLPFAQQFPTIVRLVGRSVWSTVLLSGMFESWFDALLIGVVILFIQVARGGLIPLPLGWWPRLIERVPLLFRLIGGFVILYLLSQAILAQQMGTTDSFRPILILTAIGMVILYLLAPGNPTTAPQRGGQPR